MGPAQKVRQRRTFWVGEVKLAGTDDVTAAKAFAVTEVEVVTECGKQGLAVGGTGLSALLKLNNVMPDIPEGLGEVSVDRTVGLELSLGVYC